jgi:hypothetical protein
MFCSYKSDLRTNMEINVNLALVNKNSYQELSVFFHHTIRNFSYSNSKFSLIFLFCQQEMTQEMLTSISIYLSQFTVPIISLL